MRTYKRIISMIIILLAAGAATITFGQGQPDPAKLISAQREAMNRFAMLDGVWRGTAWVMLPSGEKHQLTQTERVGPFLEGSVMVIEGRGYEEDGSVSFNALGIISFNPQTNTYSIRSYAQGQAGDFSISPTEEGYQWEIPAGPMTIQYKAMVSGNAWKETGERISPDGTSIQFYEMTLNRIADTNWPSAGAIAPK
jgi:hypothetical protein